MRRWFIVLFSALLIVVFNAGAWADVPLPHIRPHLISSALRSSVIRSLRAPKRQSIRVPASGQQPVPTRIRPSTAVAERVTATPAP